MTEFYDKYLKYKTKYINLKDKLELEGSGWFSSPDTHNNYCVFFYDSGNTDIGILNNMVEGSIIKESELPKKVINLYKYQFNDTRIHSIYRPDISGNTCKIKSSEHTIIKQLNMTSIIKIIKEQIILNNYDLDMSDDKKKINALIKYINQYNDIVINIEKKNKLLLALLRVFKKCNMINTNFNINNNIIVSPSLKNNENITDKNNEVNIINKEENNINPINTGVIVKIIKIGKEVSYKFILKTSSSSETQNNQAQDNQQQDNN